MKFFDMSADSDEYAALDAEMNARATRASVIHSAAAKRIAATFTPGAENLGWTRPCEVVNHPDRGNGGGNNARVLVRIERQDVVDALSEQLLDVPGKQAKVRMPKARDDEPPDWPRPQPQNLASVKAQGDT